MVVHTFLKSSSRLSYAFFFFLLKISSVVVVVTLATALIALLRLLTSAKIKTTKHLPIEHVELTFNSTVLNNKTWSKNTSQPDLVD